jgi:hypothetical protein
LGKHAFEKNHGKLSHERNLSPKIILVENALREAFQDQHSFDDLGG